LVQQVISEPKPNIFKRKRKNRKKRKRKPFLRVARLGCQGFCEKNTTRRVEIFFAKPEGLDLDSPMGGGLCEDTLTLLSFFNFLCCNVFHTSFNYKYQ
jgi:hypothetical protein